MITQNGRWVMWINDSSRLCVIIFAYGIAKCLPDKTFKTILTFGEARSSCRRNYQYRSRFHTETGRAKI